MYGICWKENVFNLFQLTNYKKSLCTLHTFQNWIVLLKLERLHSTSYPCSMRDFKPFLRSLLFFFLFDPVIGVDRYFHRTNTKCTNPVLQIYNKPTFIITIKYNLIRRLWLVFLKYCQQVSIRTEWINLPNAAT